LRPNLFHFPTENCNKIISSYMASNHTEEKRLRCMKNWNIIDENGNPTPPVANAASNLLSLIADLDVGTESESGDEIDPLSLFKFGGFFSNFEDFFSALMPNSPIDQFLTKYPLGFDEGAVFKKILRISKDTAKEDLKWLISFAVERGNNLEKIAANSSSAAITEIRRLEAKYDLVTKATSPTSITLDRICLAFPMATCHYMKLARNPVVNKKALLSVCSDYPLVMMHKAFATLIPNNLSEGSKTIIIDAHLLHQAHFCAIIGRGRDGSSKKPRDYIGS
jgi:Tenuivirus/Phlebovirus nucleocapsid protein